jgi:hypothetical protein
MVGVRYKDGQPHQTRRKARGSRQTRSHLLYHEVGHRVDRCFRRWSKADHSVIEEVANQYAFSKTTKRSTTFRDDQLRPPFQKPPVPATL